MFLAVSESFSRWKICFVFLLSYVLVRISLVRRIWVFEVKPVSNRNGRLLCRISVRIFSCFHSFIFICKNNIYGSNKQKKTRRRRKRVFQINITELHRHYCLLQCIDRYSREIAQAPIESTSEEFHYSLLPVHIFERHRIIPNTRTNNIEKIPTKNNVLAASKPNRRKWNLKITQEANDELVINTMRGFHTWWPIEWQNWI